MANATGTIIQAKDLDQTNKKGEITKTSFYQKLKNLFDFKDAKTPVEKLKKNRCTYRNR